MGGGGSVPLNKAADWLNIPGRGWVRPLSKLTLSERSSADVGFCRRSFNFYA